MHNAPPVDYPVGRFFWGRRMVSFLAGFALVGLIVWYGLSEPTSALVAVAVVCWFFSVMLAKWFADREFLHEGHLIWDGEAWYWRDSQQLDQLVQVQVLVDSGRAVLLACDGLKATVNRNKVRQFVWLQHSTMPLAWHGFRCAVYSRPMGDAPPNIRGASLLEI